MRTFNKIILMFAFKKSFKTCVTLQILILILLSFYLINFYSFHNLKNTVIPIPKNGTDVQQGLKRVKQIGTYIGEAGCNIPNSIKFYHNKIMQIEKELDRFYFKKPNSVEILKRCKQFEGTLVQSNSSVTVVNIRDYFTDGQLIKILKKATLLRASSDWRGTQLKLLLNLSNEMSAIFKPKWYPIDEALLGLFHFRGRDRHLGEVVAFYLSILLGFKNAPVAAIRKLDINELLRISDRALSYTFVRKDNHTCLYGICFNCNRSSLICPDVSNTVEGSMVIYLPPDYKLKTGLHPWIRSYTCNISAVWEVDNNYCAKVKQGKTYFSNGKNTPLFFDIMDASVFDFLIDNGDRHHYDYIVRNNVPRVILLDNGRGMGNADIEHIDIMAPLFQCCFLRNSTWNTLLDLRGGNFSYLLRHFVSSDPEIVLTEKHFKAFDRRLLIIFAVLEDCFRRKGKQNVILNE